MTLAPLNALFLTNGDIRPHLRVDLRHGLDLLVGGASHDVDHDRGGDGGERELGAVAEARGVLTWKGNYSN